MRPSIAFHVAPKHFIPSEDIDCEIISDDDDDCMIEESRSRFLKRAN